MKLLCKNLRGLKENMTKNKNNQVQEAIDLLRSDGKDVFVADLETSIEKAIDKAKGRFIAHVESVVELSGDERESVSKLLTSIFQREIETTYVLNDKLLGGLKITVGDWKLDATLLHQIEKMKNIFGGII